MTHCDIFIKCTKPNYKEECEFSEYDEHQSSMCKFAKRHSMLGPTYNDIFSCTNEKAKEEYLIDLIARKLAKYYREEHEEKRKAIKI